MSEKRKRAQSKESFEAAKGRVVVGMKAIKRWQPRGGNQSSNQIESVGGNDYHKSSNKMATQVG